MSLPRTTWAVLAVLALLVAVPGTASASDCNFSFMSWCNPCPTVACPPPPPPPPPPPCPPRNCVISFNWCSPCAPAPAPACPPPRPACTITFSCNWMSWCR